MSAPQGLEEMRTLDTTTIDSPGWWLKRLYDELFDSKTRRYLNLLNNYMTGNHRLPEAHKRSRAAFSALQRLARSNYTGLVANSVLERLEVTDFTTGTDALDKESWRIWQANRLDVYSALAHSAALTFSKSYVVIGVNPKDPTTPLITVEDPRQMIAELDPNDRMTVLAALKVYDDDVHRVRHAIVMLPDRIVYYEAPLPQRGPNASWTPQWQYATIYDNNTQALTNEVGEVANPLGEVSVVVFVNRPQLDGTGMGEFEDVIDIQDRINNGILDRLVISKMQAYRQRWMTGVSMKDENGNSQNPLQPGADLVWGVEDEKAKFGDFAETNLAPVLAMASDDIRDLAAVSRTPPHYLLASMVNISGDALQAAEAGLVSKVKNRILSFSDSWESVMRLAFKLKDGTDLPPDTQTHWRDPALYTLSSRGDAAVKFSAAGVPWSEVMATLDYTPQQIETMRAEKIHDAMLLALQMPQPAQPGAGGATPPVSPFAPPVPSQLQTGAMRGNPV